MQLFNYVHIHVVGKLINYVAMASYVSLSSMRMDSINNIIAILPYIMQNLLQSIWLYIAIAQLLYPIIE